MPDQERDSRLDVEEKLAGDADGTELNGLLTRLDAYVARAKKSLDEGLPPDEFQAVSKYKLALEAAKDVAEKSWRLLSAR